MQEGEACEGEEHHRTLRVRNTSLHPVPCVSCQGVVSVHNHGLAAGMHRAVSKALLGW